MSVTRRDFLKYCIGSAAALGLETSVVGELQKALAADTALPSVLWLNGASCTGCTVSLANLFNAAQRPSDVADLLINTIALRYNTTLMGAAGDLAVQSINAAAAGPYILAVEGGIPTAFGGHSCILWTENGKEVTALEAVRRLAPRAAAVLSIGTCAGFGGIPRGTPNPTGILSVREACGVPTINISGCPTHPDWIVWTVANLLAGVMPALDADGRPRQLFGGSEYNIVHKQCPRKGAGETKLYGDEGKCLKELGCRGPAAYADCPSRKWNNGTNWCIGANSVCLACTQKDFPDKFTPIYRQKRFPSS